MQAPERLRRPRRVGAFNVLLESFSSRPGFQPNKPPFFSRSIPGSAGRRLCGNWPFGVSWSTICGNRSARLPDACSGDTPVGPHACNGPLPSTDASCWPETGRFWPRDTQELTTSGQPALLEGLHQPGQPARLILDQLHHGIEQTIAALCVACRQRTNDRIEKSHVHFLRSRASDATASVWRPCEILQRLSAAPGDEDLDAPVPACPPPWHCRQSARASRAVDGDAVARHTPRHQVTGCCRPIDRQRIVHRIAADIVGMADDAHGGYRILVQCRCEAVKNGVQRRFDVVAAGIEGQVALTGYRALSWLSAVCVTPMPVPCVACSMAAFHAPANGVGDHR